MISAGVINVPNPRTGISLPSRNYEKSASINEEKEAQTFSFDWRVREDMFHWRTGSWKDFGRWYKQETRTFVAEYIHVGTWDR